MSVVPKLMTSEELLAMPDDNMRHELVRGELTTMVPAGWDHGKVGEIIEEHLRRHVRANRLGVVPLSDTGYILSRNPDTVRAPDVSFVRIERDLSERGFYPGAPDLAVEVASPNDRFTEVQNKVREYLRAGTRMVIVVEPDDRIVTVHTPAGQTPLTIDDTIDGGDVVPGWKLPLREIFG